MFQKHFYLEKQQKTNFSEKVLMVWTLDNSVLDVLEVLQKSYE